MAVPRSGGNQPSSIADVPRPLRWRELDIALKIKRGIVQGAVGKELFARSLTPITAAAWEDVPWDDVSRHPIETAVNTTSVNVVVNSDNNADAPGGTGARLVTIVGLGTSGNPVSDDFEAPFRSENINLNFAGLQLSANEYFGGQILEARVIGAGTGRTNAGTITVARTALDGGETMLEIPPGFGTAMIDHIAVPLGWVCVIREIVIFWSGDTQANWRLRILTPQGTLQSPIGGSVTQGDNVDLGGGHIIDGESTFWFQAIRDVGGAVQSHLTIYAALEFYLISDIEQPPLEPLP